jgi:hypothetical protein
MPRPALWLNLVVLTLALASLVLAEQHRGRLDGRFDAIVSKQRASSNDTAIMRNELALANVTRDALVPEVDRRLKMLSDLQLEQFYIAIDTAQHKLRLHFGPRVVRECAVQIGAPREIVSGQTRWKFVAFRGAMNVTGKVENYAWEIPDWVYAMKGAPAPVSRLSIPGGLGRYIVMLPNGYVIHSPPAADSPLQGPKPGSFLVSEADLRAIWPRMSANTRVYVY